MGLSSKEAYLHAYGIAGVRNECGRFRKITQDLADFGVTSLDFSVLHVEERLYRGRDDPQSDLSADDLVSRR